MKKNEIAKLVSTMKHQRTEALERKISALKELDGERATTKSMYFWSGFGNASSRSYFIKKYDMDYTIQLTGDVAVRYKRDVNPSRNYAYASDSLSLLAKDRTEKFTLADANKIVAALQEIVDGRGNRK